MFRSTRSLISSTRAFSTSTFAAGDAKQKLKRESTFVRVWIKPKEAWPIFAMLGGAFLFVGYKFAHDFQGPDYHFDKKSRSTIDYIENDKDAKQVERWGNSAFRKGPEFARERSIWKKEEELKKSA